MIVMIIVIIIRARCDFFATMLVKTCYVDMAQL